MDSDGVSASALPQSNPTSTATITTTRPIAEEHNPLALKLPFNDVRLAPGEEASQQRLEGLLQGIQENLDFISLQFPVQGANIAASGKLVQGVEGLRVVRGTIKTDGAVKVGSGYSLTAVGTGEVKITFSPPFLLTPTVVASAGATSAALVVKVLGGSTPSKSEVTLVALNTTTGAATVGLIEFIAVGPR